MIFVIFHYISLSHDRAHNFPVGIQFKRKSSLITCNIVVTVVTS